MPSYRWRTDDYLATHKPTQAHHGAGQEPRTRNTPTSGKTSATVNSSASRRACSAQSKTARVAVESPAVDAEVLGGPHDGGGGAFAVDVDADRG